MIFFRKSSVWYSIVYVFVLYCTVLYFSVGHIYQALYVSLLLYLWKLSRRSIHSVVYLYPIAISFFHQDRRLTCGRFKWCFGIKWCFRVVGSFPFNKWRTFGDLADGWSSMYRSRLTKDALDIVQVPSLQAFSPQAKLFGIGTGFGDVHGHTGSNWKERHDEDFNCNIDLRSEKNLWVF